MENILEFNVWAKDGSTTSKAVSVKRLCLGRSTSRDIETIRSRYEKIRAEGYQVHGNPNICRKSRYLVTQEDVIEVQGPQTSGEVEYVAVMDKGEAFISVGSDHNDRTLVRLWTPSLDKVYDTAKSKQMVPAVVASDAWKYEDVKDHWDQLNLRSYITVSGNKIPYQDFKLGDLFDLEYHFKTNPWLREDGVILLGGSSDTLPSVPSNVYQFQHSAKDLVFPPDFHFEIRDPLLNRTISHSYTILSIEEQGSLSL